MHQKSISIILGIFLIYWTINGTAAQVALKRNLFNLGLGDVQKVEYTKNETNKSTTRYSAEIVGATLKDTENLTSTTLDSFYHKGNLNCHCGVGKAKIPKRTEGIIGTPLIIVGGKDSSIADIPWTVLLYKFDSVAGRIPICGGTLINNYFVVTASHCVDGLASNFVEVVVNEQNKITIHETEIQIFKVSEIIIHPEYNRNNINNDIALLRLAKAVELEGDSPIAPACIPINSKDDFAGKDSIAAGWGANRTFGGQSNTLRDVTLPVITNEKCMSENYKGRITENMLCAGDFENGGVDTCKGDSGGPLITEVDNRKLLIGVTSWGLGCGIRYNPGVYARVTRYPQWILSHTTDAQWCR